MKLTPGKKTGFQQENFQVYNMTYLAMSIPGTNGDPAAAAAAAAAAKPRNRNMSWLNDEDF